MLVPLVFYSIATTVFAFHSHSFLFFLNTSASISTDDKAFFFSFLILLTLFFYYSRLSNTDDGIARRLDDRLRNSSFPNIGTTCMKDAPPASTKDSYVCGAGEKSFNIPTDPQGFNRNARCSECFSKALQVITTVLFAACVDGMFFSQICPADSFGRPPTRKTKSGIVVRWRCFDTRREFHSYLSFVRSCTTWTNSPSMIISWKVITYLPIIGRWIQHLSSIVTSIAVRSV